MRMIRNIVGAMILLLDRLFSPKSLQRAQARQLEVDQSTKGLKLYQFNACPFCVKVRRAMKRLNLSIDLREVSKPGEYREQLLAGGGRVKVPCLRIDQSNGAKMWMYESSDIIAYLENAYSD